MKHRFKILSARPLTESPVRAADNSPGQARFRERAALGNNTITQAANCGAARQRESDSRPFHSTNWDQKLRAISFRNAPRVVASRQGHTLLSTRHKYCRGTCRSSLSELVLMERGGHSASGRVLFEPETGLLAALQCATKELGQIVRRLASACRKSRPVACESKRKLRR